MAAAADGEIAAAEDAAAAWAAAAADAEMTADVAVGMTADVDAETTADVTAEVTAVEMTETAESCPAIGEIPREGMTVGVRRSIIMIMMTAAVLPRPERAARFPA